MAMELYLMSDLILGNLALSRALGDFAFKRVLDKPPDGQIVTGEITICE